MVALVTCGGLSVVVEHGGLSVVVEHGGLSLVVVGIHWCEGGCEWESSLSCGWLSFVGWRGRGCCCPWLGHCCGRWGVVVCGRSLLLSVCAGHLGCC